MVEVLREIGRISGEVAAMPGASATINISIHNSPEFPNLADGLLGIARQFPDASQAIVGLLRSLDAAPSPVKSNGAHREPLTIEGERHAP